MSRPSHPQTLQGMQELQLPLETKLLTRLSICMILELDKLVKWINVSSCVQYIKWRPHNDN